MLRIALVDDDRKDLEKLSSYVEDYMEQSGLEAELSHFQSGRALLDAAASFDIILLDIQMEGLNGIETARKIREQDEEVILIFITNMIQYALDGYAVAAMDFVLKPIDAFGVARQLDKARKKLERRNMVNLRLRSSEGSYIVNARDILFMEIQGRKLRVCCNNTEYLCNNSMQDMEELLTGNGFFRCHSSYLVNLRHVESIQGNDAVIRGERIPISKHRRREFMSAVTAYYGERL